MSITIPYLEYLCVPEIVVNICCMGASLLSSS